MKTKDLKIGDVLICNETIKNIVGWVLFEEGKEYEVLLVDEEEDEVFLNHVLYANEYEPQHIGFVKEYFTPK